jgi:CBS domain containing-hemolysin-like protein
VNIPAAVTGLLARAGEPGRAGEVLADAEDGSCFRLAVYFGLAIGVSFLCSLCEAGILSVRKPQIMVIVNTGKRSGRLLENMQRNIERPLAAILTLNTFAHTLGAAGVGAESLRLFGDNWVALISILVTLAILVFSEIIPKTLGAVYANPLIGFTAHTVQGMIWLVWPLVVVMQALSSRLRGTQGAGLTREEIEVVADLGKETGVLHERESGVIRNLLQLNRIRVEDVMTPRPVVFQLPNDMTVGEFVERHESVPFSRILVRGESIDEIVGVVLQRDLHQAAREGELATRVERFAKPIHAVPMTASVAQAMDQFITRQEHIFLAVDEYGGTGGIITLEDVIETLLGVEIVDETDNVEDMRKLARELAKRRRRREG